MADTTYEDILQRNCSPVQGTTHTVISPHKGSTTQMTHLVSHWAARNRLLFPHYAFTVNNNIAQNLASETADRFHIRPLKMKWGPAANAVALVSAKFSFMSENVVLIIHGGTCT